MRRVNAAVDAALVPGEVRLAATYLQGQGNNLARAILGPMMSDPFIIAISDQRLLVLAMDKVNARNSTVAAWYLRQDVGLLDFKPSGVRRYLTLRLPEDKQVTLDLLPEWTTETAVLSVSAGPHRPDELRSHRPIISHTAPIGL